MGNAPVTRRQVVTLARLARLHLEPDEVDRMTVELGGIIEYMDILAAADLETARDDRASPPLLLREDEPGVGLEHDAVLGQSADADRDGFVVPPFKEG